jgi:regulatory protein
MCFGMDGTAGIATEFTNMAAADTDKQITALRPTKRDPMRLSIHVDGRFVVAMSRKRIASLGLRVEQTWTDELAERVAAAAAVDKAALTAMNSLARRAQSRGELADRLRKKGFDEPAVQTVLEELSQRGLLDDLAYARAVVADLITRKRAGPRLLRHKLFQKKLNAATIDQAVGEARARRDAVDDAREIAQKRLRTAALRKADVPTRKRRVWSLLARRGYDSDVIRSALEQVEGLDEPFFHG